MHLKISTLCLCKIWQTGMGSKDYSSSESVMQTKHHAALQSQCFSITVSFNNRFCAPRQKLLEALCRFVQLSAPILKGLSTAAPSSACPGDPEPIPMKHLACILQPITPQWSTEPRSGHVHFYSAASFMKSPPKHISFLVLLQTFIRCQHILPPPSPRVTTSTADMD